MNLGDWDYTPNALGEVIAWTDAKNQNFTADFDKLGRPKTRIEPEGTTTWTWGTSAASHNIGRLASVSAPGHSQSYDYDNKGRLVTHTSVGGGTYEIDYTYDANTGFLDSIEYPESTSNYRFKVEREYANGILKRVKRADGNQNVYWEAISADAFGNTVEVDLGNGVTTVRGYDGVTGLIDYIESGVGGGTGLQNLSYSWDKVGNLISRTNVNRSLTEDFYYDSQYRLDYSQLNSSTNLSLTYDAMGNIQTKSDVSASTWTYHATKKNAVITAGSNTYAYDPNGNMTTRKGKTITWSSYNYPTEINDGSRTFEYSYGANREKWKLVYTIGSSVETSIYVGDIYEKNTNSGGTDYRHYVEANGQAVAMVIINSSSDLARYVHTDYHGSIEAITLSNGALKVNENFSAFGERRDPTDWSGGPPAADIIAIAGLTDQGYTGHQNLINTSLVHMKGRVFDAQIGRSLSADPYIPDALNTQAFNRYSYVYNNPMSYTDPNGYFPAICTARPEVCFSVVGSVISFIKGLLGGGNKQVPTDWCGRAAPAGCGYVANNDQTNHANDEVSMPNSVNSQTDESIGDWLFNSIADSLFGRAEAQDIANNISLIRENIAATAESYIGNAEFALDAQFENFPPGEWKCNCFVSHVLTLSGVNPPRYEGGIWPVRAGDWANPNFQIPGWQIVDSPIRGDVAAFGRAGGESGHVGIVVGNGTFSRNVIGAGRYKVEYSTTHRLVRFGLGWLPKVNAATPVVYRRYLGTGD